MDEHIRYVRSLLKQGYDAAAIQQDLLSRGVQPETVSWLLDIVSVQEPELVEAALPTPPAQPAAASFLERASQPSPTTLSPQTGRPMMGSGWKGYLLVTLICLLPTILIACDAPYAVHFGSSTRTLLTLADIIGVIGLCLYVIDLALATRLGWLEDMFGGLNKVYIAHAMLGSMALIAILLHPVLISLRYVPLGAHSVASIFIPTTAHMPRIYGLIGLYLMLDLLILTLYVHLPYRLWLASHKLLGLAYLFICLHILYAPNEITSNVVMRWYLILLCLTGAAAYIYRTLLPNVLVRRYKYVIDAVKQKGGGVTELTMSPTTRAIHYHAGQFIFVSFQADGLSKEWHPFSIVSPPQNRALTIDMKSLGGYTKTMSQLLPHMAGMTVYIEGAYGRFSYRNFRNVKQVWIAGGIGITPFLSMAQSLRAGAYNIDLYYCAGTESELIDLDILARQQSNAPDRVFRVIPFPVDKYKRRLTADVIAATTGTLSERDFLICGPQAMMAAIQQQLLMSGVNKYKIHTEEFSIT